MAGFIRLKFTSQINSRRESNRPYPMSSWEYRAGYPCTGGSSTRVIDEKRLSYWYRLDRGEIGTRPWGGRALVRLDAGNYWVEIPFAWTIMKAPIARVSGAVGQARSSGSVWHAG